MSNAQLNNTTAIVSLPDDAFAKAQAALAFKDDASGNKLIGQAQQRMVYAIRIHDANLIKGKSNSSTLPAYLERGQDGKPTAASNACRDLFVSYFVGDKPDTKELNDHDKLTATKAYAAKSALVKLALEIAAYCEKHGTAWSDFNTKTNSLMVYAHMLMPHGAKGNGRMAPTIDGNKVIPAGLIELNGRSVSYSENTKDGEKTRNKAATVAHMLSCVRPVAKKRAAGGMPNATEDKAINPKKADSVAASVDLSVLIGAIHAKLCAKGIADKSEPVLVQTDLSPLAWRQWSDICLTVETASKLPAFKGKAANKAAYDALQAKAA